MIKKEKMIKLCHKCGVHKSFSDFGKCLSKKDGLQSTCKECRKNYCEVNREKENIRIKNWCKCNSEKRKIHIKKWDKNNTDKRRAIKAKRRASELQRTPKWLNKEHYKQIENFYKIANTLSKDIKYEVDHIIPLQGKNVSGLHVPWNLQVLTRSENRSKSNKE